MNSTTVSTPAYGTPAMASPIPPSTDWMTAVRPTPSATPRIAMAAMRTSSSPRCPPSRRPMRSAAEALRSPFA